MLPAPAAAARLARPQRPSKVPHGAHGGRRRGAEVTGAGRAVPLLNPRTDSGKAARLGSPPWPAESGAEAAVVRPGDGLGELAEGLVAGVPVCSASPVATDRWPR